MSGEIRLYMFQCGSTTIPLRNFVLGAGEAGEIFQRMELRLVGEL